MTKKFISFQEALGKVSDNNRYLLLGNGFSIACNREAFHYKSLFQNVKNTDWEKTVIAKKIFDKLGTQNFEEVIKILHHAVMVLSLNNENDSLARKLNSEAEELKKILVSSIADNHPALPSQIKSNQYQSVRQFLSHFKKIYTLNYDLLLYWSIMHDDLNIEKFDVPKDDGFGKDENNSSYIIWQNEDHGRYQVIYYLHGAIHLFDTGIDTEKYTWKNTGVNLFDQINQAIAENKYPIFISDGDSSSKLSQIKHQPYLHHCYKSFKQTMKKGKEKKALFLYGHSLADNDDHIFKEINTDYLFISIYGDKDSSENKRLITKTSHYAQEKKIELYFYQAEEVQVWS